MSPRRALLPAAFVVLALTAGCTAPFLDGGDARPGATETVPGTADVVVHVDVAGLRDDEALDELRDLDLGDAAENYSESDEGDAFRTLANASRVDLDALYTVTVFTRSTLPGPTAVPGPEPDPTSADTYAAAVLVTDWRTTDLVASIENASRADTDEDAALQAEEPVDLQRTDYRGHALYVPANESREGALGVLGDGVFAVGSAAAVRDAVDVQAGEQAAMNGTLRAAYRDTPEDALVRFAVDVPRERIPDDAFESASRFNTALFANVTAVDGAFFTGESSVGAQVGLRFTGADVAGDAASVIDGARQLYRGLVANETAKALLAAENLTVEQAGPSVTVRTEHSVAFLKDLLRRLANADPESARGYV